MVEIFKKNELLKKILKMEKNEKEIIKVVLICDIIHKMEGNTGKLIPLRDLIKEVIKDFKIRRIKTNEKEIREILNYLLSSVYLYSPRGDYIQKVEGNKTPIDLLKENLNETEENIKSVRKSIDSLEKRRKIIKKNIKDFEISKNLKHEF